MKGTNNPNGRPKGVPNKMTKEMAALNKLFKDLLMPISLIINWVLMIEYMM